MRRASLVVNAWLVVLACLPAYSQDPRSVPASERKVLLDLYASTGGRNWINHKGWGDANRPECEWFGVICDFDGNSSTVEGLYLDHNGLAGALPSNLGDLRNLREIIVDGNHLHGPVPAEVLRRFDAGELRFFGYAGQFSPIVQVTLEFVPSGVICGDYTATLRVGGPDMLSRKVCRHADEDDRATFWEHNCGYAGDIDNIARLIEVTHFETLAAGSYERNMTHGASETITILYNDGTQRSVGDYGEMAPYPMWLLKRVIAGAVFNVAWEETTMTPPKDE